MTTSSEVGYWFLRDSEFECSIWEVETATDMLREILQTHGSATCDGLKGKSVCDRCDSKLGSMTFGARASRLSKSVQTNLLFKPSDIDEPFEPPQTFDMASIMQHIITTEQAERAAKELVEKERKKEILGSVVCDFEVKEITCMDCYEGEHEVCRQNGGYLNKEVNDKCLCHRLGHNMEIKWPLPKT